MSYDWLYTWLNGFACGIGAAWLGFVIFLIWLRRHYANTPETPHE